MPQLILFFLGSSKNSTTSNTRISKHPLKCTTTAITIRLSFPFQSSSYKIYIDMKYNRINDEQRVENTFRADIWLMVIVSQLVMSEIYKSWQWIRKDCTSCFEEASSRMIDCNWKRILQSKMCRSQNWQRENTYRVDLGLMVTSQLVVHKMYKSWQEGLFF